MLPSPLPQELRSMVDTRSAEDATLEQHRDTAATSPSPRQGAGRSQDRSWRAGSAGVRSSCEVGRSQRLLAKGRPRRSERTRTSAAHGKTNVPNPLLHGHGYVEAKDAIGDAG